MTLKAQALSDKTASGKNYFCSPRCASKASSRAFYERQAKRAASAEGEEPIRYPIRGVFFGCCASTMTAIARTAPANRIDPSVVFFNDRLIRALFIMRTEAKKSVIYEHHFQWLSGKCPSLVSDEKHRAAYLPVQGDGGEGSTLRAACFAYETKGANIKTVPSPSRIDARFDLPVAFSSSADGV